MGGSFKLIGGFILAVMATLSGTSSLADEKEPSRVMPATRGDQKPLYDNWEDSYITRPLLPYQAPYANIDGKHLLDYVRQITAIARRYKDAGHQDWGRLAGKSSDHESAEWTASQYRRIGLQDVRIQSIDMPPVWSHENWRLTAAAGGKSVELESAMPSSQRNTPIEGVDLELVYVGTGTAADFMGRDVKGKAVVIYKPAPPGNETVTAGAAGRAQRLGAAAVLTVVGIPGNVKVSGGDGSYGPAELFAFNLGNDDGEALRRLIEETPGGAAPKIHIQYAGKLETGLTTANVWGVLPGATDEKILIIAHRNSWFDGAVDNAAGEAAALGLAEHFSAIPRRLRRRTIVFIATPGHHRGGALGVNWLAQHPESVDFDKTALIINAEHLARVESYLFDIGGSKREVVYPNQAGAYYWYVGGSATLKAITAKAFKDFGVAVYRKQFTNGGDATPVMDFAPSIQIVDAYTFFHTDGETNDKVPYTGLENITRAYAYIIDQANRHSRKDLLWITPGNAVDR